MCSTYKRVLNEKGGERERGAESASPGFLRLCITMVIRGRGVDRGGGQGGDNQTFSVDKMRGTKKRKVTKN